METMRLFVGTSPNNDDIESQAVLEYTLRRFASQPIELSWMKLSRSPKSSFYSDGPGKGWQTKFWATPFSGFRWALPDICKYEGKAIYMDSDFIFRADIAELWNQEFQPGKVVIASGGSRYCCSLWNCAEARKHIPPIEAQQPNERQHMTLTNYFSAHGELVQRYAGDGNWNVMDQGPIKLNHNVKAIHYTVMHTQPHLRYAIPRLTALGVKHWMDQPPIIPHPDPELQEMFDVLLAEARENGYPAERYQGEPFGHLSIRGKA